MALCLQSIGACPSSRVMAYSRCSPTCPSHSTMVLNDTQGGPTMGFFDARFGAYLAVAALLIVTPGPDTALVTRHALLAGRRAAAFTTLGIGIGSLIWALTSVLGIAVLL